MSSQEVRMWRGGFNVSPIFHFGRMILVFNFFLFFFLCTITGAGVSDKSQEKIPVPDAAAQKVSAKLVGDIYKNEISAAKNASAKAAVAVKLLSGGKAESDPVGGFTMFRMAKDLAA